LDWYSVCIKKFNTQGVLIFSGVGGVTTFKGGLSTVWVVSLDMRRHV
jgi:hypothetical protein